MNETLNLINKLKKRRDVSDNIDQVELINLIEETYKEINSLMNFARKLFRSLSALLTMPEKHRIYWKQGKASHKKPVQKYKLDLKPIVNKRVLHAIISNNKWTRSKMCFLEMKW